MGHLTAVFLCTIKGGLHLGCCRRRINTNTELQDGWGRKGPLAQWECFLPDAQGGHQPKFIPAEVSNTAHIWSCTPQLQRHALQYWQRKNRGPYPDNRLISVPWLLFPERDLKVKQFGINHSWLAEISCGLGKFFAKLCISSACSSAAVRKLAPVFIFQKH